jgi:hypothetical protein
LGPIEQRVAQECVQLKERIQPYFYPYNVSNREDRRKKGQDHLLTLPEMLGE